MEPFHEAAWPATKQNAAQWGSAGVMKDSKHTGAHKPTGGWKWLNNYRLERLSHCDFKSRVPAMRALPAEWDSTSNYCKTRLNLTEASYPSQKTLKSCPCAIFIVKSNAKSTKCQNACTTQHIIGTHAPTIANHCKKWAATARCEPQESSSPGPSRIPGQATITWTSHPKQ